MIALAPLVLAGTVADRALRDAITGDLLEEHADLAAASGRVRANWWLLRQLLRSFPHFASLTDMSGPCLMDAGFIRRFYGGLALVVAAGVALSLGTLWVHASVAPAAGAALPFLGALLATVAAAYLVAVVVASAPLVAALAVGVVAAFAGFGAALLGDVPSALAEWVTLQLLLPFAALAGGLMRARQLC